LQKQTAVGLVAGLACQHCWKSHAPGMIFDSSVSLQHYTPTRRYQYSHILMHVDVRSGWCVFIALD